ncbi:MAG TPA: molybdenum cofactor guanylyltransferase [Nitrospiraceae bacterium]|nr:molybdenum cofactor guanylyltransferase [Nitrospiraceae bacterium]
MTDYIEGMMEIEVTGVLLAGGKSRRMGEDKRYLVVGEQTLLERGLGVLRSMFQEVLVVIAQDSAPLDIDARVVRDLVPDCGSLGGIYTGLIQATSPYIFTVACDMPFLNQAVITQFTTRRDTADIVMARLATRLHPMHALYGKGCLPAMEQMIVARQLKIQELVSHASLRVQYVTEADLLSIDPSWRSFHNVNTPEDLEAACSLLARISPPGQP